MPALDHVSASFERGKVHSIIGRSGAGKSTLLRCLNQLEKPDYGNIFVNGQDLVHLGRQEHRALLQTIGTVFQRFNLLSRRTVLENILLPMEWLGLDRTQSIAKAQSLITKVGLQGLENRYPAQLSGGQSQRVAIARALATNTQLLLCDEFTSALDPETSLEVLGLLRHLNKTLGVTIILITHDMSVVREVSDFIYVMEQGQIVEFGTLEDVFIHPHHPTTQSLLQGLFMKELPRQIQQQLCTNTAEKPDQAQALVRVTFFGEAARRPVMADLIRLHNVPVNILAGSLDHLHETVFGSLLIAIPDREQQLDKAFKHFKDYGLLAEILGYLPEDL